MQFFNNRRKIKSAVCFKRFRVKLFARAALQTTAIRRLTLNKRTTDVFVPATEKFCHQPNLFPENEIIRFLFSNLFFQN